MRQSRWSVVAVIGAGVLVAAVGCGKPEGASEAPLGQARQAAVSAPDFVVTAVSGPVSTTQDRSITVSVTLCNQGTVRDSTQVELLLSTDAIIEMPQDYGPGEDMRISGTSPQYLEPGECRTLSMSAWFSSSTPEGAYYLGAIADPEGTLPELSEDNNAKAGNRIGIGAQADFIITSVTGPTSVEQGGAFTASVTVCNQGTLAGSAPVELYLSTNRVITPPVPPAPPTDLPVGSSSTLSLGAGQCRTLSISGQASVSTQGAYYLGAAVDPYNAGPELIEDNNTRLGHRIGVGSRGDFIVKSVAGPASARQGQSINVSLTVCNQGTVGDSTQVHLLLSSDALIQLPEVYGPGEDVVLGSVPTPHLNPGQCQPLSIQGSVSAYTDGAYYLGAIADPDNTRLELIEDNNAKAGNRMGVGTQADFIITSVTGPTSATYGQAIPVSVTVCNQGIVAESTTVALYLSSDSAIVVPESQTPYTDQLIGTETTENLGAGQCQTLSITGSASVRMEGAYFLGAVADPSHVRPELIEDNNTKRGSRIGVGSKSDFIIKSVSGPTSAQHGQSITVWVNLCNQGTRSDSTRVELLLSLDATIKAPEFHGPYEDLPLSWSELQYLNPGQCQMVAIQANISSYTEVGAYYLGAIVDLDNATPELIEDNNSKAGYRFGVGAQADFTLRAVTGPASAQQGQSITGAVTVCNQGTVAESTTVALYLSSDTTLVVPTSPSPYTDQLVGTGTTSLLGPGQCQKVSVSGPARVPTEGAYYLGAIADPDNARPELIEDNNTRAVNRIGVGARSDFIVKSVSGPASAQQGQSITVSVTVCNQGTIGEITGVDLLLSSDATIEMPESYGPYEDVLLTAAHSQFLSPGQCQTLSMQASVSAYTDGAYYLGAIIDAGNTRTELIEDNNAKVGNRIGIGAQADFIISAVSGPASVRMGQAFTSSVTVCNQGTVAESTTVALYLSSDSTLVVPTSSSPYADQLAGTGTSSLLAPGQCQTLSVSGSVSLPREGPYYLGAAADYHNTRPELIEDNNTKVGNRMGVGSKSDFIIKSVAGPASAQQGQSITVTVTVCNQGTVSDSTRVDLMLSSDATIEVPEFYDSYEDVRQASSNTLYLEPGQCQTLDIQSPVWAYRAEAYYLGAVADYDNTITELIEDNNTKAGNVIHVTP